jgi:hypothetical protein
MGRFDMPARGENARNLLVSEQKTSEFVRSLKKALARCFPEPAPGRAEGFENNKLTWPASIFIAVIFANGDIAIRILPVLTIKGGLQ